MDTLMPSSTTLLHVISFRGCVSLSFALIVLATSLNMLQPILVESFIMVSGARVIDFVCNTIVLHIK